MRIAMSMWSPSIALGGGDRRSGGGRVERVKRTAVETAAVLRGRDLERAQKRAAHRLRSAEAAGRGDGRDRLRGVLQASAGGLDAHPLDIAGGSDTRLGRERAGEVPRAHVGAPGER